MLRTWWPHKWYVLWQTHQTSIVHIKVLQNGAESSLGDIYYGRVLSVFFANLRPYHSREKAHIFTMCGKARTSCLLAAMVIANVVCQ